MEIRFKRFLSLAMAIIMVVSMTPANVVFATENTACEHTAKTETTVAATCTENGSVTETCDACGAVISQTVIGAGHKYEGTVTKAPTCTEAGEKTFTCAVCSDSYTESVDALGHSTEETVTKTPTCTEAGEKTVTCTVCEFSETVAVDALGHTYDEGEVTTEATCTVDGVKTFTCTVCGDTKTEAIPVIDHVFDAEGNCACGEKQIEATANEHTEHSYEMGSAKCTACDYVEEGYLLFILNGDGSVGMSIDGSKSVSAFCLRTALEDARVFANNAFLFGITGTPSYVVYMYEDSTENASFEIGADVTINGNGHKIVCAEGVTVTNNGTLNDVEIVETKPACEHPTHGTDGKCECGATVAHTYTDGKCTVCGAVDPDYVAPAPTEVVVATLAELQEALADNTNDLPIVVTETITIPAGETVTLNLNGKTIIATDNKAANVSYELFYIYGGLTVTGNGTIELTSTSNDTSWAKSSTIFHNRGGVLVIQSGTFTHKGGTAMAYVVDNNANSYGNATTTIKGGNLSSTYVAIRNRMDTYGANGGGNGVATLNIEGGSLSGKRAVWGQVSSAGCKGNITITGGNFSAWEGEPAVRVGTDETGEIVTAISGGTFTSDVSAYVVEGYVQNENGTVTVAPSEPEAPTEVKVATLAELQTAMDDNSNDLPIVVTETITIPAGETVVIDLNSKTVTSVYQTDSTTKHIYPLDVYGNLTIKDTKGNGTITGRGIFVRSGSKLTIDGGSIYAIDSNGGSALFMYGGEVVINGGHIEQKAEGTYNFAIQAPDGATVTVNGGWVGGNHGAIAATGAAVVINDGTFVCTGTAGMTDNVLYSDSNGSIIINGGNFVADKDIPAGGTCVYDANGGVTINGGTFGNSSGGDVWGVTGTTIKGGTFENLIETQHIADGYELGEDGTVIKKQPAAPAVTVDEVKVVITDNGNNSYDVVLGDEESFPETGVTMTFPATGDTNGMAYVVHEHAGKNYIYVGKVAGGKFSFKNTVGFSTFTVADGDLADAIAAAESGATVTIIADIEDVEVEVVKNLTITGSAKLNNVTINALNAAELTVSGLTFTGNSWINSAAKLSVSSVTANVAPSNSAYTNSRNAFISLGRNEGKDIEITVKNSTICTTNNADAINGWARIIKADISGNNFGSENAKYGYGTNVVKIMGVATNAELTFAENTVYADYNGFAIAPNNTRDNHYTVIFDGNKFFGTADFMWIETQGAAYNYTYAAVNATSDNTINGNAITAADIKTSETTWYCYAGLDVVTDENGKVIGGTLAYCAEDAIADGFELGEDGKVTATAPAYVAQIGEQKFETLDAALNAAKTMTGDVVVEIYDKVTLNSALSGSFDSIKFVGKDTDAEIYLDVQGYTTATGKRVFFEDLKLSKSEGGFVDNAGFMNLAFGIYDVAEVTYTNCTFLNGACASFGKVTFNGCTFYRSYDRYGLWAYGAADVVVDGCTFDDIRGIKLFSEGKKQVTDLTVKNTTFTEKVDGKPAIVLTDGKSVTLENNTYSSTGVFELDLEGKPNGTPVTSDVAPTCINDNGTCGVLVDGKIYTTVAQAAEVATSGSKVTLLHESTETVELPAGVELDKNNFAAEGITVKQPAVAEVNGTKYESLQAAIEAANGGEVKVLCDVTEELTSINNVTLTTDVVGGVTITSTYTSYMGVDNVTVGAGVTVASSSVFSSKGTNIIEGALEVATTYYHGYGAKTTVRNGGKIKVSGNTILRYNGAADAGLYIYGDNDTTTVEYDCDGYIGAYSGTFYAKDASVDAGYILLTNTTDGSNYAATDMELDNTTVNIVGASNTSDRINMSGRVSLTLKNGSKIADVRDMDIAAGTELSLSVDENSSISVQYPNIAEGVPVEKKDNGDGTFGIQSVKTFVAAVNGVEYTTLTDAVAALKVNGGTLTLLADANETIAFTETTPIEVTIDLNGFTITSAVSTLKVSNGNTVTIKDSVGTGKIISTNAGGEAIAITLNGHVILESGYVYNDYCAVWMYNATENGTFVMNGGTLEVPNGGQTLSIGAGKATINGGKILCNKTPGGSGWNTLIYQNGTLEITGGEFLGTIGNYGKIAIAGGTFSYCDDPNDGFRNEHLADGYATKVNADGSITVYKLPTSLSGSGTQEDPFLINNIDDLKFFRNSVNNGTRYNGQFVKLNADIDLNEEEWTPIGDRNVDQGSFLGTFDGGNHTISNLWISEWNKDGAGFFSKVGLQSENISGTVKNVTFENVTIVSNHSYVGVIAQAPSGALIENVHIVGDVTISGYGYVGGIVGHGYPTINNSSVIADGNITANYWGAGAILGFAGDYGARINNATVEGIKIHSNYGAAASVTGSPYGAAVNGATVSNVEITSNSDEHVGYVAGGGQLSNVSISNVTATVNGQPITPVDAVATVNGEIYFTLQAAIDAANAGDPVTLLADVSMSTILTINKAITLDGNDKTLTSTAARAINVSGASGVTIKNLTINASGERAINIIQNATNVTIDNVTATAANYTVNVASSASNAVVAIEDSTLNGLCTVNVSAAGAQVTVNNSTINCNDNNTTAGEAYSALSLNKEAIGGSIVATDTTVNVAEGSDSTKGRNGAENGTVTINGSTEGVAIMVAAITYPNTDNYHAFATLKSAVEFAKAGDTITLIRDVNLSDILVINKAITLDGNGKTLTSTAARAINVSGADGVTIKNLTIDASGERAINIIQNATNVAIENVTATAANYTVNVASSASNAVVAIKNSTLNGLCTVNVSAAGAQVTVNNSTINCNDNNTTAGEAYSALSLNKEAIGGSIVATDTTVNVAEGSDSTKGRNGAENGTVTINGSTEGVAIMVAAITYPNTDNYHAFATLKAAVEFAKAGDTITLIRDVNLTELVKIDKAITLDLGGKKITSTAQKAIEVYANATIQNGTIEAAQRCVDTRKAVELTLTDVTLIADKYTSHGNPQPLTIGGSENGTKVNMNEVTINAGTTGYGIITFVDTELTATDSTISGYSALYVKPGSEGSEFNFVNSTLSGSTGNNDVEGNSFSTIAIRADNVTVNVDANSTVNATGNYCWAISMESKFANENGITGSTVNVAGTINGQILTSVDTSKNTISVKAEYADELAAEGYACSAADANGMITVLGKAVAKVGETLYTTLQAAVDAAPAGGVIYLIGKAPDKYVMVDKPVTFRFMDGNSYSYKKVFCSVYTDPVTGEEYDLGPIQITDGIVVQQATFSDADAGEAKAYVDTGAAGHDGEELMTLQAALDAAAENGGGTVKLIGNLTVNAIVMIPSNVTLNIEAYTLTANSVIGVKGSKITATTDAVKNDKQFDGGELKVAKENLVLSSEAYYNATKDRFIIPVWNPGEKHYVFANMMVFEGNSDQGIRINEQGVLEYQFNFISNTDIKALLFTDDEGSADNAVSFEVQASWATETGTVYQNFVYTKAHVKAVSTTALKYDFLFKLRNFANLKDLKVTATIVTDSGVRVIGTTHEIATTN